MSQVNEMFPNLDELLSEQDIKGIRDQDLISSAASIVHRDNLHRKGLSNEEILQWTASITSEVNIISDHADNARRHTNHT